MSSIKNPLLILENVSLSYEQKVVLWNVNGQFPRGTMGAILGPNGAGKSSLLKTILKIIPHDSGKIILQDAAGNPLLPGKIAYVPQQKEIDWQFPISVYDLVMMGRYPYMGFWKRAREKDHQAVKAALQEVEMESYADRQIGALSGGQKQRIFLARCIALDAPLLILDEPMQGLDAPTTAKIFDLLRTMVQKGKSIIMVHHHLATAHLFDWGLLLCKQTIANGPIEEIMNKNNLEAAYGPRIPMLEEVQQLAGQQPERLATY